MFQHAQHGRRYAVVRGDLSCGYLTLRISPKGPSKTRSRLGASEIRYIEIFAVIVCAYFMFEEASSVGCGLRLPRIVHFAKAALESAISRRRLEDTMIRHDNRRKRYIFDAGRPEQRRMRPRTDSHCVFAKWDLQ